jgi:1,4-dihydroxy-2-naphthoyl-CoA hydrolase
MSESIWFGTPELKDIEWMQANTLSQSLGIRVVEIGRDFLKGEMPVNEKTKQPFGICHGGAYVAMAEELGSIASWLMVDREVFIGVGVEINANHLKAVRSGLVTGVCRPIHVTGRNHVWEIRITDDAGDLCCISRFTSTIVARSKIHK